MALLRGGLLWGMAAARELCQMSHCGGWQQQQRAAAAVRLQLTHTCPSSALSSAAGLGDVAIPGLLACLALR